MRQPASEDIPLLSEWSADSAISQLEVLRHELRLGKLVGLRFVNPHVEKDFRLWHNKHAVPFVRIGMIASLGSWLIVALLVFIASPQTLWDNLPILGLILLPCLVVGLASTSLRPLSRLMLPTVALVNSVTGMLAVSIGFGPLFLPEAAMGGVIIAAYFGFTVFRLRIRLAAATVFSYLLVYQVVLAYVVSRGRINLYAAGIYFALPIVAYITGLMICGVLDRVTRETYLQERLIAAQTVALEKAHAVSEALLQNVLPDVIAKRLKKSEDIIADGFANTSVLFADIVDFTPLSQRMTPAEVVQILDDLFSRFDDLVHKHRLEKIKTIGDAYMVAAGVPTPRTDHADVMVLFARDMQQVIRDYNGETGMAIQLRIGINSGPVVAGVIGRMRFLYDLWGDCVNTASRMESHGAPDEIQLSEQTKCLLDGKYRFEDRGMIDIKGKGLMRTYFLREALPILQTA